MKLRFKKDHVGYYDELFKKGQIREYKPWPRVWQRMTEQERVAKGIFVECYGMGDFNVFRPDDVEVVEE